MHTGNEISKLFKALAVLVLTLIFFTQTMSLAFAAGPPVCNEGRITCPQGGSPSCSNGKVGMAVCRSFGRFSLAGCQTKASFYPDEVECSSSTSSTSSSSSSGSHSSSSSSSSGSMCGPIICPLNLGCVLNQTTCQCDCTVSSDEPFCGMTCQLGEVPQCTNGAMVQCRNGGSPVCKRFGNRCESVCTQQFSVDFDSDFCPAVSSTSSSSSSSGSSSSGGQTAWLYLDLETFQPVIPHGRVLCPNQSDFSVGCGSRVTIGMSYEIQAVPTNGYIFMSWDYNPSRNLRDCSIEDPNSATTNVTINGDCGLRANFSMGSTSSSSSSSGNISCIEEHPDGYYCDENGNHKCCNGGNPVCGQGVARCNGNEIICCLGGTDICNVDTPICVSTSSSGSSSSSSSGSCTINCPTGTVDVCPPLKQVRQCIGGTPSCCPASSLNGCEPVRCVSTNSCSVIPVPLAGDTGEPSALERLDEVSSKISIAKQRLNALEGLFISLVKQEPHPNIVTSVDNTDANDVFQEHLRTSAYLKELEEAESFWGQVLHSRVFGMYPGTHVPIILRRIKDLERLSTALILEQPVEIISGISNNDSNAVSHELQRRRELILIAARDTRGEETGLVPTPFPLLPTPSASEPPGPPLIYDFVELHLGYLEEWLRRSDARTRDLETFINAVLRREVPPFSPVLSRVSELRASIIPIYDPQVDVAHEKLSRVYEFIKMLEDSRNFWTQFKRLRAFTPPDFLVENINNLENILSALILNQTPDIVFPGIDNTSKEEVSEALDRERSELLIFAHNPSIHQGGHLPLPLYYEVDYAPDTALIRLSQIRERQRFSNMRLGSLEALLKALLEGVDPGGIVSSVDNADPDAVRREIDKQKAFQNALDEAKEFWEKIVISNLSQETSQSVILRREEILRLEHIYTSYILEQPISIPTAVESSDTEVTRDALVKKREQLLILLRGVKPCGT